jgi:acyl carrier protein
MPLPVSAIGELYLGGLGVARGYLSRPALTAERFIASPFENGARLYKTGDLVSWAPDGNLRYWGRNDFQVKIRGQRIELGEIENVLSTYPSIQQAVVLGKKQGGSQYLVAYYVSSEPLDHEEILGYLRRKLPEYMLPSTLIYLEALPLKVNGKLDRQALPNPDFISQVYVAPRNALENKMCQIWAEVLNLPKEKIGIHDDFFSLGGHSILAIKLVNKLKQDFTINLATVFEHSSICQLSQHLQMKKSDITRYRKKVWI